MSTIRLFYGRDSAEMKSRLEASAKSDNLVSTLEVRETVLEDEVIDSIVALIETGNVETVQLDDCGAYLNASAISMARALGKCKHVILSEPTFLSKFFLESFLTSATKLESLKIQDRLLAPQVEALAKGLKGNATLHTLDLSRSRIENVSALAQGLFENKFLKCIKLRSVGLHDEEIATVVSSLCGHPVLEFLDLSFNHLRDTAPLGRLLQSPKCRLSKLLIGYQNLWQTPKTNISSIVEGLKENKTLRNLGLANNKLRDDDTDLLVTVLKESRSLEQLDIRENIFYDRDMVNLAEAAKVSRGLKKLLVVKNPFGSEGSLALLEAVQENLGIIYLDVCCSDSIHQQIHYNTALNRGGRRLLLERPKPPLALWPLAMERANNIDWGENFTQNWGQQESSMLSDPRIDVLYHFLQKSPVIFEGMLCET
ncbi:leucine-rich repeat, ribonuclease inhibitor subtype [Nitzschia inconspicua]|uniref:Leucine-rich repeat, ribonuclease inhibitor subtype n=1 Tax=Nitzschia inconspicua TaxID=303405 RepID=A0A9K3M5J1_9STRA|nr:leucine-rich repeat, ribonuclease inhibitor subtype [Nitzschia inconspicua]